MWRTSSWKTKWEKEKDCWRRKEESEYFLTGTFSSWWDEIRFLFSSCSFTQSHNVSWNNNNKIHKVVRDLFEASKIKQYIFIYFIQINKYIMLIRTLHCMKYVFEVIFKISPWVERKFQFPIKYVFAYKKQTSWGKVIFCSHFILTSTNWVLKTQ